MISSLSPRNVFPDPILKTTDLLYSKINKTLHEQRILFIISDLLYYLTIRVSNNSNTGTYYSLYSIRYTLYLQLHTA